MSQDSKCITMTFHADVYYRTEVDHSYGEDADGNRGVRLVEEIPTTVELHEVVPPEVAAYLKALAQDLFERGEGR